MADMALLQVYDKIAISLQRGAQPMDSKPTNDAGLPSDPSPAKKPYAAPTLVRWGTLRDLTLAVGNTGGGDNGKVNFKKRTR